MTDERMDARLRAAGQRWRDRTDGDTAVAELPDVDEELLPPTPRHRRTWFVAVAAAAVVALIAGLTFALRGAPRHGPPNAEAAGLQGVVWLLPATRDMGSSAPPPTLYIGRDGTLVADDECRLIGGHVTVTGQQLTLRDFAVRLKACTDQYGAGFYDKGTNVLRGPAKYSINSTGLTITRAGFGSLHFLPAPKAALPPSLDVPTLTDTTWRAPDGTTLRIDSATGDVSGTYCSGHIMVGLGVHLDRCGLRGGSFSAAVVGPVLTLTSLPSKAPFPVKRRTVTFHWQPTDPSIIDPASLTGRTWKLESVAGRPATGTLRINGRIATVYDGCNKVRFPVHIERGAFWLGPFAPPRQACTPQSSTAGSILSQQPAAWVVRNGKLIIYGGGSQAFSLVYGTAQQPSTTSALQGDWTLAKVFDASGGVRPTTATATLSIAANGTVTGTDGCRTFSGTVSTSGTTATFSLTMPEPACSPVIEQTASLVDRVLSGAVSFTVAPDALVLSQNEIGRLSFTGKAVGGQDPQLLTAHDWQITTVTYGTGHFRNGAPNQGGGLLTFKSDRYEVQHTCAIVHGTAQLAAGTMTLSQQQSFDHSCPPPFNQPYRGDSQQAIDAILAGEVHWSVDGSVLTLSGAKGKLVAIGGIRSDLTGSTWRLTATAQSNVSRSAVGIVVLSFPNKNHLRVDRCYTSGAFVAVGDSSFTVFRLHTTVARPCPSGPPGTQQQNETIDSVLTSEPLWSIVGDTLTLTGANATLTFRRKS